MKPRVVSACLSLSLACSAIVACGNPSGPDTRGNLAVEAVAPNLELTNQSGAPVYTFIVDAELAARIEWMACTDPATCDALQPTEHRQVPYTQIDGYSPASQNVIVYWWHLVPGGNSGTGFKADTIRATRIGI